MSDIIRNLSNLELLLYNFSKNGDAIVAATGFVNSKVKFNKEILTRSLKYLQERHPYLKSVLTEDKSTLKTCFKIHEDYSNKIEIEWIELEHTSDLNAEIIENLERFNSELFQFETSLIWRYQVLSYIENSIQKYCLSLVIPAFLSDGLNICAVLIESINILNALLTGSVCDEMNAVLEPMPSLHALCDENNFFGDTQKERVKELNTKIPIKFLFPDKFKSMNEIGSGIHLLKLDSQLTECLVRRAKQEKVKFNSFFNSAMIHSLRNLYSENDLEFPKEYSNSLAVNLRIRYKPNLDLYHVGFHVCLAFIEFDQNNSLSKHENIWEDSRLIDNIVTAKTNLEDGTLLSNSHSSFILDQTSTEESVRTGEVNSDVGLSNLGMYINDRCKVYDGPISLDEIYLGDSFTKYPHISCAVVFYVIFWRGELMIRLTNNKKCFGTKFAKRWIQLLEEVMRNSLV